MTRSSGRWACFFCSATRVTVPGIESHLRHKHPDEYREAVTTGRLVYDHVPEGHP